MQKETGDSDATHINSQCSVESNVFFSSSSDANLVVKCHLKSSTYDGKIISNVYEASFCSAHGISLFYGASTAFPIPLLSDCLWFAVGNFKHAPTYPLFAFGLARGQCNSRQSNWNHPNLFHLRVCTPVSSIDHTLTIVRPTIYSNCAHRPFVRMERTNVKQKNLPHVDTFLLQRSPATVSLWFWFK